MSVIDVVDDVLAAHERQGAPAAVIAAVRSLRSAEAEIDEARYQPLRAAELKRERRDSAAADIASELNRLLAEAERAPQADAEQRDSAERERPSQQDGHAVDPHRFSVASTPAEVVVLLREAEAAGADTLRRAWAFAEPRLRQMAADDMRRHRVPGATSAFAVWMNWQARMKSLSQRAPSREDASAALARRQSEVRQQVLSVARVVGLDAAIERAARKAAARPPVQSTITVGGFFDRFKR